MILVKTQPWLNSLSPTKAIHPRYHLKQDTIPLTLSTSIALKYLKLLTRKYLIFPIVLGLKEEKSLILGYPISQCSLG